MTDLDAKTGAGLKNSPAPRAVVDALSEVVADGIDVHRCLAAKALGQIGSSDAVPQLIKALLDEDEDVRTDAAEALATIVDPASADQLLENLIGDPCSEVKFAAIRTLAQLNDKRVAPLLIRLVKGRDDEILWDEQEFFSSGWDDWVDIQIQAICALADMGVSQAVPDIIEVMKDESAPDIAETVFKALARMGKPGIDALGEYLNDPLTRTRRRAASALASAGSPEVQDLLPYAFSDPAPDVRMAALRALAEINPADTWLLFLLQDKDAGIRAETTRLLQQVPARELLPLLDDASADVRAAALKALDKSTGLSVSPELTDKLAQMTRDDASEVSGAACVALAGLEPDAALENLTELLSDANLDFQVRSGALEGLRRIGNQAASAALIAVVDDEERPVRLAAMAALSGLAKEAPEWPNPAGEALISALNGLYDPDPEPVIEDEPEAPPVELTEESEEAEQIEEPEEEPVLSTMDSILRDAPGLAPAIGLPEHGVDLSPDDMERLAIAKRVVGKRKIPKAQEIVLHEDVRRFAAKVLGDLDHDDVTKALGSALGSDDPETARAAADALARISIGGREIPPEVCGVIFDHLEGAALETKLSLIRVLAGCGGAEVVSTLSELVKEEDRFIRTEAIRALAKVAPESIDFTQFLGDMDPSVRIAAATAVTFSSSTHVVEKLAEFAMAFEGYHRREVARLLRTYDRDNANAAFLQVLRDADKKRYWPVAIEALEELNQFDLQP